MSEAKFIRVKDPIMGEKIINLDNIASVEQTPIGSKIVLKQITNGVNDVVNLPLTVQRVQDLINSV